MAFKAEELTSKIFPEPGAGLWAGCPQDTLGKGKPCGDHTKQPCPQGTRPPDDGPGCPQDTIPTGKPPRRAEGPGRGSLVLLQAQLRDRLAQSPLAAGR